MQNTGAFPNIWRCFMVAAKGAKYRTQFLFVIIVAVLLVVCNLVAGGKFLAVNNMLTVLIQSVFYTFVGWGMVFIFTPGIIDLSIGATVILAANIGAVCAMDFGMGYVGLIVMTIVSAMVLQMLSVLCSVQLRIPSWISGLGMALIYEAVLNIYVNKRALTAGSNLIVLKDYRALGQQPVMIVALMIGLLAVYILFNRTTLGFNIEAIGNNDGVASAMGINRKRTILLGALIGGLFIGIGSLLQESYVGKFYSQTGLASLSSIFRSLAILLLAQSFSKIFTMPVGVVISSVLVMGLFNFLTIIGVPSGTGQEMCLGALVILCGVISHWKHRGVVK